LDAIDLPLRQCEIKLTKLPSKKDYKCTPKSLHSAWNSDVGEAGDWSEFQGYGGIINFDDNQVDFRK
jgi:hypothetical protein